MADVFVELEAFAKRCERLRKVFGDFYKSGPPLLQREGKIPGVVIGELIDGKYFDLTLAGTTARFVFTFDHQASKGIVGCYRLDHLDPKIFTYVGKFEFNGEGDTGQIKTGRGVQGDRILVGNDADACLLAADLMYKAILSAPSVPAKS